MTKAFTILCLTLAVVSVLSAENCQDTSSLRVAFGIDNSVTTPTAASGVTYCKSIKAGNLCCTAAAINGFQAKSDALIANLTSRVAARDTYYASVRNQGTNGLQNAINNYQNAAKNAASSIAASLGSSLTSAFSSLGSSDSATTSLSSSLGDLATLGDYTASTKSLTSMLNNITVDLYTFQSQRSTCVIELVKIQAAVWCLACDPNAATNGLNTVSSTLNVNSDLCSRMTTSCGSYFMNSNIQNAAFSVQALINTLNYQTAIFNNLKDPQGMANAAKSYAQSVASASLNPVATVSGTCNATYCPYICNTLLSANGFNLNQLVYGGQTSSRLLEEESVQSVALGERVLASGSGSFNPDNDEAGTTVTFTNNPAGVSNHSGAFMSYGSVILGMIAVISAMML